MVARAALVIAPVATAAPAAAQSRSGFAVDRFEPAERDSAFFVVDPLDLRGALRPALGAVVDYSHDPLVVSDASGAERLALVRHEVVVHLGASLVLGDRFRVAANVPIAIYQDGEPGVVGGEMLGAATSPAFGDVRLAVDMRVIGEHGGPLVLGVGARGWLPTGLRSQFTGDGSARLAPQILAGGELGPLVWGARVALVYRARSDVYAGNQLGSELFAGAGVGARLQGGRLVVGPEIWATSGFTGDAALLAKRSTEADWIIGAHYMLSSGLQVAAGMGTGLGRGLGAPAFRALAAMEWGSAHAPPRRDRDGDGIDDLVDACPDVPGLPDGDPSYSGCPAAPPLAAEDADGDAVFDNDDACPTVQGPRTSDPMTNGCPPSAIRPLAVVTKNEIRIGEQLRFVTESAELLGDSESVLAAVVRLLDEHPEVRRLRVEGHTDAAGSAAFNEELSTRRASAVAAWLVAHGVDAARIESRGYGSSRPIADNGTDEGRAQNRRVVFTIVEKGRAP